MVFFGQIVVGPPGCGKTTYCHGSYIYHLSLSLLHTQVNTHILSRTLTLSLSLAFSNRMFDTTGMLQFLTALDRRAVVINMDFANDAVPYTTAIDVRELITLETAMKDERLGPNGGLVFCMEKLVSNIAWLTDKIESLRNDLAAISFL